MKSETERFPTLKKRMLFDPEARAEYERLGPEFQRASALIAARRRTILFQVRYVSKPWSPTHAPSNIE